jgi:hypothetical protein
MANSTTLWDSIDADDDHPMHASEAAQPRHATPSARMTYRQWTERLIVHPPLVAARELAGLSDERLAALAAQYEQAPSRGRALWLKAGAVVSALALALGVALGTLRAPDDATLATAAFALVLAGAVSGTVAAWLFYVSSNLDQAHRRLGLLVTVLDEQHPWLYRALLLQKHPPVDAYRARMLAERGGLRGVDHLLMREIAQAHERLELTQTASAVVARLQGCPPCAHRAEPLPASRPVATPAVPEAAAAQDGVPPSRVALAPVAA